MYLSFLRKVRVSTSACPNKVLAQTVGLAKSNASSLWRLVLVAAVSQLVSKTVAISQSCSRDAASAKIKMGPNKTFKDLQAVTAS
jgi:hypothetical protein